MVRSAAREVAVEALLITLLILVLVQCVTGSPEETTSYPCCPSPQITFNPRCEQHWATVSDGKTIARFTEEKKNFTAPIKELQGDLMVLEECVDLKVTINCMNNGLVAEERIRYHGDPCPTQKPVNMAPGNQGCVPLLLLLLLLAALILVLF